MNYINFLPPMHSKSRFEEISVDVLTASFCTFWFTDADFKMLLVPSVFVEFSPNKSNAAEVVAAFGIWAFTEEFKVGDVFSFEL